jgi:uncharacterized tellurite resistance protein B-like protein
MSIWNRLGLIKDRAPAPAGDPPAGGTTAGGAAAGEGISERVRQVVDALDELDPARARWIASFAFILGRVARADLEISEDEVRAMERILVEKGNLPEEQAIIVVHMAKIHNELFGGTDNYLVTREFDQNATHEEKMALLDCLFAVATADLSISSHEDNEIRVIAGELHLDRSDFLGFRSRYRDHLEVLKPTEEEREGEREEG